MREEVINFDVGIKGEAISDLLNTGYWQVDIMRASRVSEKISYGFRALCSDRKAMSAVFIEQGLQVRVEVYSMWLAALLDKVRPWVLQSYGYEDISPLHQVGAPTHTLRMTTVWLGINFSNRSDGLASWTKTFSSQADPLLTDFFILAKIEANAC